MFIELIDSLRCVNDHADSWLVAAISAREERFVISGTLGCPICHAEYPIVDGVARFGAPPPTARTDGVVDPDGAARLGAFLGAAEDGAYLAAGEWTDHVLALAAMVPARYFAMNPPARLGESEQLATFETAVRIPLAPASLRGIALDAVNASPETLDSAVRALASRGRVAAPANAPLPHGVDELARGDGWWVAERAAPLVPLRRR